MDQMFQKPEKSSEILPPATGPGEVLPQIVPVEHVPAPEKGKQQLGAAGVAVQQAYTDDATVQTVVGQDDSALAAQQAAQAQIDTADIDVIEKVWVEKAKSIVAKTKDNPREQSTELSGMKRDYIEKRFGKSLPDNRAA